MAEFTDEDDALLEELGVDIEAKAMGGRTPREERIIAGFEEIQRFVNEHGRLPQHGEDRDIFERLYAVRLERLRGLTECRTLLEPMDRQKLLEGGNSAPIPAADNLDDDALLEALGVDGLGEGITDLRHVRSSEEKRAAEEIAKREKCEDFEEFKPMFIQVKKELDTGIRQTRPFQTMAEIQKGQWFIVGGQIAYVADVGNEFVTEYDRRDSRLRVIYDNGTESDVDRKSVV